MKLHISYCKCLWGDSFNWTVFLVPFGGIAAVSAVASGRRETGAAFF